MILKDIFFPSVEENIAYDRVLLESAEAGSSDEVLRFWEAKNFFIVLGRISKLEEDVKIEEAKKDGVEIIRRMSGGGTVLQGPGCLNYSLILSYERNLLLKDIRKSYEFILNKICDSLKSLKIKAEFEPISDIVLKGRKFSGNAQARKKRYILHHGTILYDFPIEMIEKYLKMPKDEPLYRKGRNHSDFLTNINADPHDIKQAIYSAWEGKNSRTTQVIGIKNCKLQTIDYRLIWATKEGVDT
jgi:lipoate-protein ligase A